MKTARASPARRCLPRRRCRACRPGPGRSLRPPQRVQGASWDSRGPRPTLSGSRPAAGARRCRPPAGACGDHDLLALAAHATRGLEIIADDCAATSCRAGPRSQDGAVRTSAACAHSACARARGTRIHERAAEIERPLVSLCGDIDPFAEIADWPGGFGRRCGRLLLPPLHRLERRRKIGGDKSACALLLTA